MGTITENKVYKELNKDYRYLNNYIVAMEKSLFEDANISISKAKIFSENCRWKTGRRLLRKQNE